MGLIAVAGFVMGAMLANDGEGGSPPRDISATALDRQAVVRWRPPADLGAHPVSEYRVHVAPSEREIVVPATRLNTTVGGLANGTAYTFTVSSHSTAGWSNPSPPSAEVHPTRPNILLIVTDDQRWDSMDQLPAVNNLTWRRYENSFVVEPLCCPSRASTLSGRIPSHTGVNTMLKGRELDATRTFATMLRATGYQTAFAGKYLGGYPFGTQYVPPGWDRFYGLTGPADYYNYTLVENGKRVRYGSANSDYATDVLRDKIIESIRAADRSRPVLLEFAPNAPHVAGVSEPIPARRDRGACADRDFPFPPNFNAYDTVSEPAWMAGQPMRDKAAVLKTRRLTCETLRGVDEAVIAILDELEREGRLTNTYVVFTSDNGDHFGEHRLMGKGDLYDESIRVPLLVTGPGVEEGTEPRMTSNIDLAPTFVEWARIRPPTHFFDGSSFAASAAGSTAPEPTAVLLRGCRTYGTRDDFSECGASETNMGKNWGVRTARYMYIEYPSGERQLFDVVADPHELTNLAPDPAHADTMTALHEELVALRK
jgi:arylsulfatase A-like enzyme